VNQSNGQKDTTAQGSGGLTCEVYDSFEAVPHSSEDWDDFVAKAGGDIYLSYDWCRVWWKHYGQKRDLRIFIFRKEGKIVGLLPMFVDRFRLGIPWFRLAKVVGSDFTLGVCNPPVQPEHAPDVFRLLFGALLVTEKCHAVWLGPIHEDCKALDGLGRACKEPSSEWRLFREHALAPHTFFNLPGSFEDYLMSLGKSMRGNFRRSWKQLNEAYSVQADSVVQPAELEREFEKFVDLHTAQWAAESKLGHFGDWPDALEFNRDLVRAYSAKGRVRLHRLIADGEVVSYQYCFAFGDCNHWRLPARVVGHEWDRFSLGNLTLVLLFETSIGEGIYRVEGGQGHYDYKIKLGGEELSLRSLLVVRNGFGAALRARLFTALADFLQFFYYRGWFHKISPRLPLKRRPLWGAWIRTRN